MPRKSRTPSVADVNAAPGGAASVDKAISVLAAFQCGDQALGLAELAKRTALYKSTVLRALSSLEHARLVRKLTDGRYALGTEIARLHGIFAASFMLDSIVLPVLRKLVALTGESAAFHVRQGSARLCLYRVDSPHPVRDHVTAGEVLPLYRGSGGRVLVAFDQALLAQVLTEDAALYQHIVKQGFYATTEDRLAEVAGISAPVFQSSQALAGALTLTMPAHRYQTAHIGQVVAAAAELSQQIS